MTDIERIPPYDRDAEAIVIGSALQDADTAKALEHMPAEAFYVTDHRHIWAAIQKCVKNEGWVDAAVIARHLKGRNGSVLERVRDAIAAVDIPVYGVRHARHVLELHRRRLAIWAAHEVQVGAYDLSTEDLLERLDKARDALIEGAGSIATARGWAQAIVPGVLKQMLDPPDDREHAISFGFSELDRLGVFIRPGDYHVIAGWTSQGKSTFANQWAWRTASRTGRPVLYVSLEMRPELVVRRALVAAAGIEDPGAREVTPAEKEALEAARGWTEAAPVLVPQMFPRKLPSFLAWAREVCAEIKPCAMIVDHIGYLRGSGTSLYERTTDVSRGLRSWAQEGGRVPVLALSQLSREGRRENRPPKLHDLRDSGAVEEDACSVLAMYYPWQMADDDGKKRLENRSPTASKDAWVYVLKNREGSLGRLAAHFDGARGIFTPRYTG
jgi:replicative DNA helicase